MPAASRLPASCTARCAVRPRCPAMWGNLLTGLVAGLVALAGVIYTQSRADTRERER
jgi:hypothetical protein